MKTDRTQSTDIADIVKLLEWEYNGGTIDAYVTTESNRIEYIGYQVRLGGPNEFLVRYNDILIRPFTCHRTLKEAQERIWKLHIADMEDRIDLTKLQPQPEPFWKPIEQCPKVKRVQYFLYHKTCGPTVGGAHVAYRKHGYTHFAEIPACEVQP